MTRTFPLLGLLACAVLSLPLARRAAAQPASNAPPDTAWPLRIDSPDGLIEVYQPQPETLVGDKLTARAAVSLAAARPADPVLRPIWLTARLSTDPHARPAT